MKPVSPFVAAIYKVGTSLAISLLCYIAYMMQTLSMVPAAVDRVEKAQVMQAAQIAVIDRNYYPSAEARATEAQNQRDMNSLRVTQAELSAKFLDLCARIGKVEEKLTRRP